MQQNLKIKNKKTPKAQNQEIFHFSAKETH